MGYWTTCARLIRFPLVCVYVSSRVARVAPRAACRLAPESPAGYPPSSYGILLHEIWTDALLPYKGKSNLQVWVEVAAGYRLPRPESCPQTVYAMMTRCWAEDPHERPTFTALRTFFEDYYSALTGRPYSSTQDSLEGQPGGAQTVPYEEPPEPRGYADANTLFARDSESAERAQAEQDAKAAALVAAKATRGASPSLGNPAETLTFEPDPAAVPSADDHYTVSVEHPNPYQNVKHGSTEPAAGSTEPAAVEGEYEAAMGPDLYEQPTSSVDEQPADAVYEQPADAAGPVVFSALGESGPPLYEMAESVSPALPGQDAEAVLLAHPSSSPRGGRSFRFKGAPGLSAESEGHGSRSSNA